MKMQYNHQYDDIINMEHHKSKKHPPMSLYARSSQFAPFAALTGYEDAVRETAREVENRIEIDDELKNILDGKIQILIEQIKKSQKLFLHTLYHSNPSTSSTLYSRESFGTSFVDLTCVFALPTGFLV